MVLKIAVVFKFRRQVERQQGIFAFSPLLIIRRLRVRLIVPIQTERSQVNLVEERVRKAGIRVAERCRLYPSVRRDCSFNEYARINQFPRGLARSCTSVTLKRLMYPVNRMLVKTDDDQLPSGGHLRFSIRPLLTALKRR